MQRATAGRMKRNGARFSTSVLAVVVLIGLVPWHAVAVSVSVSEFDLQVRPGSSLSSEFFVFNEELEPIEVTLELVDWDDTADGAIAFFAPGDHARSCAPWISVGSETLTILPGEEARIELSIDVPSGERGTRWCGLLLGIRPADAHAEGTIRGLRRFLVKIFQTSLPASEAAAVAGLEVGGLSPLTAAVRFRNDGEVRLTEVTGLVRVESASGKGIFDETIQAFHLLPGHEMTIIVETRWSLNDPGVYLLRAVFDYGAEALVAGQTAFRILELTLVPLGESPRPPSDLDGDGLYEDIDGNGVLDSADPALLGTCLGEASVMHNRRVFDFTNDGAVDDADVEWLRVLVSKALH